MTRLRSIFRGVARSWIWAIAGAVQGTVRDMVTQRGRREFDTRTLTNEGARP